jgi:Uma2 family endonuclease
MSTLPLTVAQYEELGRAGILTEDDKVELLDGWLVCKLTRSPYRAATVSQLHGRLTEFLPMGWFVRSHGAVITPDSVPEPDLSVVRGKPGDYRRSHPTGTDVALVIEVSDATVGRDRKKAAIFARAGIPHYWIVNLDDAQIEVHSDPSGTGRKRVYRGKEVLRGKANLSVILGGKAVGTISVREILG